MSNIPLTGAILISNPRSDMRFALWNPLALTNAGRKKKGRKSRKARKGSRRSSWSRRSRRGTSRRSSARRYSRKGSRRGSRGSRGGRRMSADQLEKRLGGLSGRKADIIAQLTALGWEPPKGRDYVDLGWVNRVARAKTPADIIIDKLGLTRWQAPPKGLRGYNVDKDFLTKLAGARSQSEIERALRRYGLTREEAKTQAAAAVKGQKISRKPGRQKKSYRVAVPNGLAAIIPNPLALTNPGQLPGMLGGAAGAVVSGAVGTVIPALVGNMALDYVTPKAQEFVLYKLADMSAGIPVISNVTAFTADVIPNIATSSLVVTALGYGGYRIIGAIPFAGGILFGAAAALGTVAAVKDAGTIAEFVSNLTGMGQGDEPALLSSSEVAPEFSGIGAVGLRNGYGDGGFFEVAPVGAPLTALNYRHASLADAMYSGLDFSVDEGQAILNGPQAFFSRYGAPTTRQGRRPVGPSHYASQRGHRWGWLVKMVGWDRARQIAAMPPKKRLKAIQAIRSSAINGYQRQVLATEAADTAAVTFDAPPVGAAGHAAMGAIGAQGPLGADGAGGAYGSALFLGQ